MGHEIDLNKYQLRTDLIVEQVPKKSNVDIENYDENGIKITTVNVDEKMSKEINKKIGEYITIEFEDITDSSNQEKVKKIFSEQLNKMLKKTKIKENDKCLIIGLGNDKSTPDSLGPLTVDQVLVTNHLFMYDEVEEGIRSVSAIIPGVTGTTGIETSDLIKSITEGIKPDFLIIIDALASQALSRVNKTIQISNTGIHPGSGVGNSRKEISIETVKIPVIAIGIPTVVDAVTVVSDTINYMQKHYAFHKKFMKNPISKLVSSSQINYLKKEVDLNKEDKFNLLGIVGSLNELETKQLISEVLTPIGYNLMVTPKEVDFVVEKLANILADGINAALHKKIKLDD